MTHIRETAVKIRRDREAKALSLKVDKEEGIPDLLGYNLAYLLRLGQVAAHEELLPMWKKLAREPKSQHLTTF